MSDQPSFDLERVQAALRTSLLGRRMIWCPTVDSTQDELRRLLAQGEPEGTVVVAESQTAGRGRRGRVWLDRPGEDLLFSAALPPGLKPEGMLPVALGAYRAEALGHETRQPIRLRWPNDLVLGPAKLGGILVEVVAGHFLVGVGINVKGRGSDLVQRIGRPATTLEAGGERGLRREDLLAVCLNALARAHEQLISGDHGPIARKIAELDGLRGASLIITGPQGVMEGTALGIALDGALLIRSGPSVTEVTVADDVVIQAI